jgi:hypothetical protein
LRSKLRSKLRSEFLQALLRNKFGFRKPVLLVGVALVGLALLGPPPAFSQSCALCYTQAASAGVRMIQALRSGILILIVPPTFMSICMVFIISRKRNQFRQEDDDEDAPDSDRSW